MYKESAKAIFHDALEAVLPLNFMPKYCHLRGDILTIKESSYDLSSYKNIYLFGSGKASYTMAKEIEKLLKERLYKGLIVAPYDNRELQRVKVAIGSHPIPSALSLNAAEELMQMMQECDEDDLYIFVLSGGSSALMELPIEPITLEELQLCTKLMLESGLEINSINAVRKHLSQIKGGRLASLCKATGVVLVLSDIVDNSLDAIGSAPLYADRSSFEDAIEILKREDIFELMPKAIQTILQKGLNAEIQESPFRALKRVSHHIVASNAQALEAAKISAEKAGFLVKKVETPMEGDVLEMVEKIIEIAKESQENCILFGGECTVEVKGDGEGGRNQHAALLMLREIIEQKLPYTFLSAGTDGIDGNSDAAGAVVDRYTAIKSPLSIESYIHNFNSYNYFKRGDSLLKIGPSGTNVVDVAILIKQ